ncbi:conserved membrane hypothetical protein [Candidatus Propionivibrio aalborgensis]|uniref:Uncharacterized protein n=2 Tax=Candidatus Propionivibrio aalborgensis TaxID=1860101 RepID=A0A1A8XLZ1_9RHOO|nr:conserved membrane hypothetical protein [Candidatus Propionivibrio aalborgensis]
MLSRVINLLVALTAITLGGFLALNYPVGTLLPISGFVAIAVISFYQPSLFLIIIPAILPVSGFAPWTGWISFEELDLLVLATATGGYARFAFDGKLDASQRTSSLLLLLSILMSVSILISMTRGFADAGGFVFGWFQGYDGPMNSVRIGKSFFLALLLIPLIARLQNTLGTITSRKLGLGIAIGLGTASIAALWERLAFTGLLDFSSDYRSTALFWEMHVGGAALDGWLLLTIPFSIWALRNSRSTFQFVLSLCLVGLAAYASLTTFSRGVYLALMVALPLLAWQTRSQLKPVEIHQESLTWGFFHWMIALVLLGTMAGLVFPTGGYRGLLALFGLIAISLSMPQVLRKISLAQFCSSCLTGLFLGALLVVLSNFLPKGPYVLYTFLFMLTFPALYWPRIWAIASSPAITMASFVGLMLSAANVAGYWGGVEALPGAFGALTLMFLILVWAAFSKRPLWPNDLRWQGGLLTTAVAVSGLISVFGGGAYMGDRFSTSSSDLDGRLLHWRQAVAMLQTSADITFGKGLGRFPANYYFAIPTGAFPGTYQIKEQNGNSWLSLVAPRHPISFGDVFRISQRLSFSAKGPFVVDLKVKTNAATAIHVEVCEKQLLYPGGCVVGSVTVKATNAEWQPVHIRLAGAELSGGPWYAPRLKMFSLGILNKSGAATLDDVVLTTDRGANLLRNGEFTNEMQHWFFTSDRDHMPWHAKNLLVNILFDQGMAGLGLFLLLTVCALWRLNLGSAREHEISPYLTAAIIGFLVVGLFDSLTDVPRLAFLYYLVILYALSLGTLGKRRKRMHSKKRAPAAQVVQQ